MTIGAIALITHDTHAPAPTTAYAPLIAGLKMPITYPISANNLPVTAPNVIGGPIMRRLGKLLR